MPDIINVEPTESTSKATNNQSNNDSVTLNEDKNIAVLMHIGGIFFGFIPALIVYLALSDNKPWLKVEAREALNFQISLLIYLTVSGISIMLLIGILLFPAILVFAFVCPILAAINTNLTKNYIYPLTIKFLK